MDENISSFKVSWCLTETQRSRAVSIEYKESNTAKGPKVSIDSLGFLFTEKRV